MLRCSVLQAALLLAYAVPAAASSTVALTPASGHPTQAVTIAGSGFADAEPVDVYLDTTDTLLLVSSATGTLAGALTIPATAAPGAHYITAIGRRSGDAAQKAFSVTTAWTQSGFGAAAQNANPYENTINTGNVGALGLLWSDANANVTGAMPTVSNGRVFVSTFAGLQAISTATGAVLWTAQPTVGFYASPAVPGNVVYAGASNTTSMYALNFTTGAVVWNTTLGGGTFSSAVYVGGMVYVGCNDNKVYALNSATGKIVWTYTTGGAIDASPAVVGGVVYIGSEDNNIYALNATTGRLLWSYTTGSAVEASPVVANGIVYEPSDDGNIYALRTVASPISGVSAGSLLWSATGADFSSPAAADGMVFYGATTLYAVNGRTGANIWSFAPDSFLRGRVTVANGVVYAVTTSGLLYALNETTGAELGHAQTGSVFLGGATISDGVIYVNGNEAGTVAYALLAGSDVARNHAPALATLHPDMTLRITAAEPVRK